MDKLFELSAQLTLDAEAFLRGLRQAESAARAVTASMARMQSAATASWSAMTSGIQQATASMQAFLALPAASLPTLTPQPTPTPDLAASLTSALSGVTVQLDGHTVGQLITPTVSRELAKTVGP